jgi:hypothetical protein
VRGLIVYYNSKPKLYIKRMSVLLEEEEDAMCTCTPTEWRAISGEEAKKKKMPIKKTGEGSWQPTE